MHAKSIVLIALCICLCIAAFCVIYFTATTAGGFVSTKTNTGEESEIMNLIEKATDSAPVSPYDWKEPIDFFRPRLNSQGEVDERIVEVSLVNSELIGSKMVLDLSVGFEDYHSGDKPRNTKGNVRVWAQKDGSAWEITDYKPDQ